MKFNAQWIHTSKDTGDVCPVFRKEITLEGKVKKAELYITALGVYEARLTREKDWRLCPCSGMDLL